MISSFTNSCSVRSLRIMYSIYSEFHVNLKHCTLFSHLLRKSSQQAKYCLCTRSIQVLVLYTQQVSSESFFQDKKKATANRQLIASSNECCKQHYQWWVKDDHATFTDRVVIKHAQLMTETFPHPLTLSLLNWTSTKQEQRQTEKSHFYFHVLLWPDGKIFMLAWKIGENLGDVRALCETKCDFWIHNCQ